MYKLIGSPFSLTATVVSDLNLTSLYWSPPELVGPLPNKTTTVHHGNITTTTFTSLKNAILGDSGNYTLTAVNECGQSSSQVDVKVLTSKLIDHYRFVLSTLPVEHWRPYIKDTVCTKCLPIAKGNREPNDVTKWENKMWKENPTQFLIFTV